MLANFPRALLRERSSQWTLVGNTISPGQTGDGVVPIVRTDGGGFWRAQLASIAINSGALIGAWRAISAQLDGGSGVMVVPMCDPCVPWPVIDGERVTGYGNVPHSDGTLFDDGAGYDQPVVECVTVGDAIRRATTLVLQFVNGGPLVGGEFFSFQHATYDWRLYVVRSTYENDDGTTTITFRPPLREAVTDGTLVEFDRPRCVMRLASQDAMVLDLEMRRRGNPSITLIESLAPVT